MSFDNRERVSLACKLIAEELQLSEFKTRGLLLAARIHDIDNINVPTVILNKPGKLTDLEFDVVKIRPVTGAEKLQGIQFDWPLQTLCASTKKTIPHRLPERHKGRRYTHRGSNPRVANTLEAMCSRRTRRPALGMNAAIMGLKDGAGALYDPVVVDPCVGHVKSGKLGMAEAKDRSVESDRSP